jgi:hypothetical protein
MDRNIFMFIMIGLFVGGVYFAIKSYNILKVFL